MSLVMEIGFDLIISNIHLRGSIMKTYMRKVGKTLLFGLVILAIAVVVYLVVPKYQIQSVRVSDNFVVITKINTITGDISTQTERVPVFKESAFDEYLN